MEIQLPEEVIQHIQSFLSGKEAARTTILSKSCYNALLTRPDLDFAECDFPILGKDIPPSESAFLKFVKKTMQRYDELNLKIQSFKLSMDVCEEGNIFLAKKLIVKATKLGATDLDIKLSPLTSRNMAFILPREVFESETLVRLSLHNCKIDLYDQTISCSRLKYLSLSRVCIVSNTLWDIISMCPMIEELTLSECKSGSSRLTWALKPELGVYDFRKLKVLSLKEVGIDEDFFRESSRFPCLKDLALQDCSINTGIRINSNSLERISFTDTTMSMFMVVFNVPRIRKFKFSGSYLPSLYFTTIPRKREWESDIIITVDSTFFRFSWFVGLSEFLCRLSSSKISLCLNTGTSCRVCDIPDITWLQQKPLVEVEKLTFAPYSPDHYTLLYGLFRCCRPNILDLHGLPSQYIQGEGNKDFKELLCKRLVKESGEKRSMSVLRDLKEVNVQDAPTEEVDDSGSVKVKVGLQLRWGGRSLK